MPPPTALVWFKRDLRVRDHETDGQCSRRRLPTFGTTAHPTLIIDTALIDEPRLG